MRKIDKIFGTMRQGQGKNIIPPPPRGNTLIKIAMLWVLFFSLLNAQNKQTLTPAANWEDATQNSDEDAKKKAKKFWKTKGNDNIDSTKHFLGTKDFNPLIIKTNATERMRITSSGNIGIGTAVPNYPFEVQVPAFVKTLSADYVHISKGLTVGDLHFCRGNNCSIDTVHTTQQRDLLLRSNNLLGLVADTVRVVSEVGTNARLQVNGSIGTRELYLNSTSIQQGNLLMLGSNNKVVGVNILPPPIEPNPSCTKIITLPWRLFGDTLTGQMFDSVSIVKYPLEGNVGIGTCYPTAKLHVHNLDSLGVTFYVTSTGVYRPFSVWGNGNVGIGTYYPEADLDIYRHPVSDGNVLLHVHDKFKTYFVVTAQGVGIGTETPQARLEIQSPTSPVPAFLMKQNGQVKFLIKNNGQTAIGCNYIPWGYTLSVGGKILCHEVLVDSLQGCDYVFEEDYPLMSWEEVEKFYKSKKHLPGVPPAKEMESQGVSLGEMNMLLLKKIEELHLYIEQLHDKIEDLEREVENLKE